MSVADEAVLLGIPLGDALDGPFSSYSRRRVFVLVLLSMYWFVISDVFVDIFAGHDPDLTKCSCKVADAVFPVSLFASANSSTSSICGECERAGGVIECPADADITSMAIDFGLQCDSFTLSLTSSFDMIGIGIGSLFGGFLSDRFGRRRVYIIAMLCGTATYALSSLAASAGVYLLLKLLMGVFNSSANMAAFTLASEIVGARLRTPLTVELWAYLFALMEVYCALVAWAMREASWRQYVLTMAIPLCCLMLFSSVVVPESPMWLQRRRQAGRLRTVLRELLTPHALERRLASDACNASSAQCASNDEVSDGASRVRVRGEDDEEGTATVMQTLQLLCASRRKTRVLFTQMYAWAAVSFAYYGLSFKSSTLSDDPYLNFVLSGLMELPATFVCARLMDHPRLGRRTSYMGTMLLIALALVVGAAWEGGATTLFMMGKFGATGAFNLIYVQTVELFPTAVRNSALGLCSAFGRVGSISAPPLARAMGATACMVIFSVTSLVGALLCFLNVPETSAGAWAAAPPTAPPTAMRAAVVAAAAAAASSCVAEAAGVVRRPESSPPRERVERSPR